MVAGHRDDPQRRRREAERLATELCDLPPGVWSARSVGSTRSLRSRIDDDEVLADVVAEVWDLARTRPLTAGQVTCRSGAGGSVVVAHGDSWSLVARSGGPVLVVSDALGHVVRLEDTPLWEGELAVVVGELFDAARGLPPFRRVQPPPVPPPWRRDRD